MLTPSISILSFPLNFHCKCFNTNTLLLSTEKYNLESSPVPGPATRVQSIVISRVFPRKVAFVVYFLLHMPETCSRRRTVIWVLLKMVDLDLDKACFGESPTRSAISPSTVTAM
ncbi:hypothetical protein R6Q59_030998 [Mikania micrantha]